MIALKNTYEEHIHDQVVRLQLQTKCVYKALYKI